MGVAVLSPDDLGLGAVFEHVREPVLVLDVSNGLVVLWNDHAAELFGYPEPEPLPLPIETLVPERLQRRLARRLVALQAGARSRLVESGMAINATARHRDGQELPVELRLSPIKAADKDRCLVLAMIRDLSQRGRLRLQAEQRLRELETLYLADEPLYRALKLEDVLQALVDVAADLLHADKTSVLVWDAAREKLSVQAARGFQAENIPRMSYAAGEGISTLVAATGDPIAVEDVRTDPRIPPHIAAINESEGIRSLISVPLVLAGGVYGVFNVNATYPRVFRPDERRLLHALAERAAIAIENARLFAQSERRRRESEALYYADAVLYRSLRLDDVLQAVVEVVTEVLGADKAQVLVWDTARERLIVGAQRGYKPETVARLSFKPGQGIAGRVAATGKTVMVEDALNDPRTDPSINAITASEGTASYICVPIILRDAVFGVFSVVYGEPRTFSEEDQRPLEALAQRAAVAVQNAELYERVQSAAALEERQRLARELHDAVTQTLFSASLIAEVIPRLWERDPNQGRARLDELRRLNRGALAEMRTLLLELRPLALTETPIDELLRQLVEATMSRTAIAFDLVISGVPRPLLGDVQVGLYRLAQEALNNIVHHAHATHAHVELAWAPESVRVCITDDGRGFDPASIPAGHLGLRIMRERANALGAGLQVDSTPGVGTTVTFAWPASAAEPAPTR